MNLKRGVAALKDGAQSLWYPYDHLKNGQKSGENKNDKGIKSGINCQNNRLRNGELLLAVARHLMVDCGATPESMSSEFAVSQRSITSAIKKIKDKLSAGLAIPGLNDVEIDNLARAMAERASFQAGETNERIKSVTQEAVAICMIKSGKRITEIAKVVGLSIKKIKQIVNDSGFDMGKLATNLVWEGYSIPEAAVHLGLKAKEVTQILAGEKLFGEIIHRKVIESGLSIAEIAESSGFERREFYQILKENGHGHIITVLTRFLSRIGEDIDRIAVLLGISRDKIEKTIVRKIQDHAKDIKVIKVAGREGISMMRLGKPKTKRESKRPATISRNGLAEWCMQHYDENGVLRLPAGCRAPADLPRRYPSPKSVELQPAEPKSPLFPAPPLSESECSARGRKRIGYMRLF